ncbi:hypothetical protein Acj133p033 [Acinetobacter phage 133]|uniref:Uncharacterized protein n=1 Tax=Acinetobacter phage 133 TaxID=2919552 RepID=D9I5Z9_9CAUD|nr:hypothetical protein Acj133p033 [Acinetobacter phage 133]ADJ19380.1 hypothetical protein Acj133p033 [Acinetobacter phage 133]
MSKVKAKIETVTTSKVGKLRDPKATMKLSLELGFARNKRLKQAVGQ